jgi:TM2 domain-containing membrane protein YozV
MDDAASVCTSCGFAKGTGNKFCPNCGTGVTEGQAMCVNCGVALTSAANGEAKSKLAAGLLGIFLGGLGIHNFYLGFTKKAVIQLVICIVGACAFGIGPIVSEVWGLIEGIFYLTGKEGYTADAKGVPLKD